MAQSPSSLSATDRQSQRVDIVGTVGTDGTYTFHLTKSEQNPGMNIPFGNFSQLMATHPAVAADVTELMDYFDENLVTIEEVERIALDTYLLEGRSTPLSSPTHQGQAGSVGEETGEREGTDRSEGE